MPKTATVILKRRIEGQEKEISLPGVVVLGRKRAPFRRWCVLSLDCPLPPSDVHLDARVLLALARADMRLCELAKATGADASNVLKRLRVLQRAGLVARDTVTKQWRVSRALIYRGEW